MSPSSADHDWTERHGDAVRATAPLVPELTGAERTALWHRVETAPSPVRPRRSRWKVVVAGVAAVATIGVGSAAAAGVFSAHTGKGPSDAEDIELGGPGERLNPHGSDFAAVLEKETRDIRFPSDAARRSALTWEVQDETRPAGGEPVLVSTGALRLWMAWHSVCAWSNEWAVAVKADDDEAAGRAATVILDARSWPAMTDTDPVMADESPSSWYPALVRAVQDSDLRGARKALFGNQSCMPGLAPALGLGKRW